MIKLKLPWGLYRYTSSEHAGEREKERKKEKIKFVINLIFLGNL